MERVKIKKNGSRRWSKDEIRLLKELYPKKTPQELEDELGRTVNAVKSRASRLRLAKRRHSYEETHRTVQGVMQKLCTQCKKWKDYREFRKKSISKDGLKIHCKECDRAYEAALHREHRKQNKLRDFLRFEDRLRVARGVKERLCCHCGKWKDESQFHRSRSSKDGLPLECKECVRIRVRRRYERNRKTGKRNLRFEAHHRIIDGVKQKFCRKCRQWKRESEYHRNHATRDGLAHCCKECKNKDKRRSYEGHRKTGRRNL